VGKCQSMLSRRHFLRNSAAFLGALSGNYSSRYDLSSQSEHFPLLGYLSDTTGNGFLTDTDRRLVERALFTTRGYNVLPDQSFDYRADVLGLGHVTGEALSAVSETVASNPGRLAAPAFETRPITVAWHYGWYNRVYRKPERQTVAFLGGDYVSSDSEVEGVFHQLKNEFGITVDALSWIPPRDNDQLLDNYRRGYFQGNQIGTRYVSLIYESTIGLPREFERVDFRSPQTQSFFTDDFEQMAVFLSEVRDVTPARIFRLNGRPVIFLFGSHTWGLESDIERQADAIDYWIKKAREVFLDRFGEEPYLVGEEMLPSFDAAFTENRWRRLANFDGVFIYHHVANLKSGGPLTLPMDTWYVNNQVRLYRRMISEIRWVANRYTGLPILIIPSLATGFAKPGFPTLTINSATYGHFVNAIRAVHENEYLLPYWGSQLGWRTLPAPVYTVGSWNEEFEGHSIFPSSFNMALSDEEQFGFDVPMAIKRAFGWNHFAHRAIPSRP